jgi:UDP-glucose 4-epimerase
MLNVLVIGGAGFVGSNLCRELARLGLNVQSLDDYSTGCVSNHVNNVKYINGDCRDINKIGEEIGLVDTVFHLGEFPRVELSVERPIDAMNRITGTISPVIEFCHKNSAKLVYSASSTRFGDSQSPYSICKEMNAQLVHRLCSYLNMQYAITYFYNVYGPNEISSGLYATLIAKIIDAKRNGRKITITAPGTQKRNFTHVLDIVSALVLVGERGQGDNYGIGADDSYSVIDVVRFSGCNFGIGEERKGNRSSSELMTDEVKALGWKQQYNLLKYIKAQL